MIRSSWTQAASIEETLALWAASLREIKKRIRPLFTQRACGDECGRRLSAASHIDQSRWPWGISPTPTAVCFTNNILQHVIGPYITKGLFRCRGFESRIHKRYTKEQVGFFEIRVRIDLMKDENHID
jgi:hypothetical protein